MPFCPDCGHQHKGARFCVNCGQDLSTSTEPQFSERALVDRTDYAGNRRRLAAFLIDAVIVGIGLILLEVGFQWAGGRLPAGWGIVLGIMYFAGFESSSKQATPGKMLLGIKVVSLNGRPLSGNAASGRAAVFSFAWPILLLWFPFSSWKQGLHDKATNSVVIKSAGSVSNLPHLPGVGSYSR